MARHFGWEAIPGRETACSGGSALRVDPQAAHGVRLLVEVGLYLGDEAIAAGQLQQLAHVPEILSAASIELQHDEIAKPHDRCPVTAMVRQLDGARLPPMLSEDDVVNRSMWRG